mgnify:CR=1 FL=1
MTNPRYPVYIVSKGRSSTMFTSRSLSRMKVPHFITIEPQDEEPYQAALERFHLSEYATLLIAPFSNHGDGSGRARNWSWDHAMTLGVKKHWVLDDNIKDFYRLTHNKRIRVESGAIFRAAEDFVDRFENVPISGFNYRFFVPADSPRPAYLANTRIYSCLLIDTACKHRWRGKFNEDTDLCLRVLKDGDCTIQFNAFLQDKCATQTVKGGNTEELYNKKDQYKPENTLLKSQMLADLHPDVARVAWKYGRIHHYVDYSKFSKNRLRYKSNAVIPEGVNNYGMKLVTNFKP